VFLKRRGQMKADETALITGQSETAKRGSANLRAGKRDAPFERRPPILDPARGTVAADIHPVEPVDQRVKIRLDLSFPFHAMHYTPMG
jgi:hypothetical protein